MKKYLNTVNPLKSLNEERVIILIFFHQQHNGLFRRFLKVYWNIKYSVYFNNISNDEFSKIEKLLELGKKVFRDFDFSSSMLEELQKNCWSWKKSFQKF